MESDLLDRRQVRAESRDVATVSSPAERDASRRPGLTIGERKRRADLEREVKELKRAHEILKTASAFSSWEVDPRPPALIAFIDEDKHRWGVEPIGKQLPVAPSPITQPR